MRAGSRAITHTLKTCSPSSVSSFPNLIFHTSKLTIPATDGTAQDTSLLIDYLSSYTFPDDSRTIVQHLVLGISLGGHSTWQCVLHDPRVTAAVVVIGCPDYKYLMTDRAKKSKLAQWTESQGKHFLGSTAFPKGLCDAADKWDPKSLLVGDKLQPSEEDKKTARPLISAKLRGKHILCLSGGKDKLVPYFCSEPFLDWFKTGLDKQRGWFNDQGTVLEDIVDENAGHEYSAKMKVEAVRFISEKVAGESRLKTGTKTSKI
jgi:pimeloyl-ACP methyl ester carboxylesterase